MLLDQLAQRLRSNKEQNGRFYLSRLKIDAEKNPKVYFCLLLSAPQSQYRITLVQQLPAQRKAHIHSTPGFPLTQQLHCHLGRRPESKHCFI